MIIIMKMKAAEQDVEAVITRVETAGFKTHISKGEERTIIGIIGDERRLDKGAIGRMDGVDRVVPVLRPYKLASRDFQPEDSKIPINGHVFWRQQSNYDGRPVLRGEHGADDDDGAGGQKSGGTPAAGRRVQAAHLPLQFPGNGARRGLRFWPRSGRKRGCTSSQR